MKNEELSSSVIRTTEGRKNLGNTHENVHENLRRDAPLNDKSVKPSLSETIRVQVRFSEVDSIQMVWHGHYITYMEDAREAFGRKYGLEYMHIYRSGYLAPMFDIKMRYHQTATVDDVLLVTITCRPTKGAKLVFDYEIRNEKDNALIFTAESTQLFTTHEGEFEPSCPPFLAEWKKKHALE